MKIGIPIKISKDSASKYTLNATSTFITKNKELA